MSGTISLIIPVKNEAEKLSDCLKAIQSQSLKPSEIIIVDGHSTDDTVSIAKTFGARVIYENYGTRAAACQIGIEASTGDFVAFTDADCIPDTNWLLHLFRHFNEKAVGVGGKVVNTGNSFWERTINLCLDTLIGSANSVQGKIFKESKKVSSISGCNCMYRRKDLLGIGGFNIDLPTAEDTDLNKRLSRLGDLIYVPDATVYHHHRRGVKAFAKRMLQYGVGRGMTLISGPQLILPIILPIFLILLIIVPLLSVLLLLLYLIIIALSAIYAGIRTQELKIATAMPFIYILEHISYSIGFWEGFFRRFLHEHKSSQNP